MNRSTVIRWESGDATRPEPDQVRAVCKILGIDPRQAAIALGYLDQEDLGPPTAGGRRLDPALEQVVEILEDPHLPEAEKQQWIEYLVYLREKSRGAQRDAG